VVIFVVVMIAMMMIVVVMIVMVLKLAEYEGIGVMVVTSSKLVD